MIKSQNQKRALAREIVLFLSTIALVFIVWGFLSLRNYSLNQKAKTLNEQLDSVELKIKKKPQQNGFTIKTIFNNYNQKFNLARNCDEFVTIMANKKNREDFFIEFNPKANWAGSFNEFENKLQNGINYNNNIEIMHQQLLHQKLRFEKSINSLQNKLLSNGQINKVLIKLSLILGILFYPVRASYFLLKWAITTLKQTNK